MPNFEGDDLKRIADEISIARKYIFQCQSYMWV